MESTSSTWRVYPVTSASEPDPLEDALDELARAAQEDLVNVRSEREERGELIEGPNSFTFVLMASGYGRSDIAVNVERDRLRVEASDFKVVKGFRCIVDPSTARTTYVNGVLSVRVDKRL